MRLVVILTLGLGVVGPTLVHGEKIVFVVPRYIRRSFTSNTNPIHAKGQAGGFKVRGSLRGSKRPYFNDYSMTNAASFFPDEKYRFPQHHHQQQQLRQPYRGAGEDFEQGSFFKQHQDVNHVVIPHGKGISHGISFGEEYIPENEFKGFNENSEFAGTGNENHVDYINQNHYGDVKFEDLNHYPRFPNQEQNSGPGNAEWHFSPPKSSYDPSNFNQETNQEDRRIEFEELLKNQDQRSYGGSNSQDQQNFFPMVTSSEISQGAATPTDNLPPAARLVAAPKPTPIILQDTVDMKEYVEKIEAFAKSWPPAAALQGFGWQNQAFKPFPAGLINQNFQGFNSWANNLPRATINSGGYEVQEENTEQPNHSSSSRSRRHFRTTKI